MRFNPSVLIGISSGLVEYEVKSNVGLESYQVSPNNDENRGHHKWVAYQRYQGQSLTHNEKVEFAVKHQLLTDETDYLIQLERQESEKSDQLPSLVKMPQMEVHENNAPYLGVPMFSMKLMEPLDFVDDVPPSILEELEQKQIKDLSEYLKQVLSGKVTFKVKELYELEVLEDVINAIRLLILMSDEERTVRILQQLCANETAWKVIRRKLGNLVAKA